MQEREDNDRPTGMGADGRWTLAGGPELCFDTVHLKVPIIYNSTIA